GEFISAEDGEWILEKAAKEDFNFNVVDKLGSYSVNNSFLQQHVDAIVNYPLVDIDNIRKKDFKVVVDVVNSTGALFVP
ncbi:hypothetical protein, partial [Rhizobium leguminosarum]|uniref:hypothetical protein n=1 Tax=Rhizobium leguminosarum TaxID=384 RepID=UPI003F9680EB